jgi:hypothetical protein
MKSRESLYQITLDIGDRSQIRTPGQKIRYVKGICGRTPDFHLLDRTYAWARLGLCDIMQSINPVLMAHKAL